MGDWIACYWSCCVCWWRWAENGWAVRCDSEEVRAGRRQLLGVKRVQGLVFRSQGRDSVCPVYLCCVDSDCHAFAHREGRQLSFPDTSQFRPVGPVDAINRIRINTSLCSRDGRLGHTAKYGIIFIQKPRVPRWRVFDVVEAH